MARVLLTAFEPYDEFTQNSSWLALMEFTRELPRQPEIVTRLYPVDFERLRENLARDLADRFDVAIHLGQAPGQSRLHLEAIGLNVGGNSRQRPDEFLPLVPDGPVAYRSSLPLAHWCAQLRSAGIPAQVSYHAGTFLCNATLYLSHYLAEREGLATQVTFLHLPLAPEQVLDQRRDVPFVPCETVAKALRLLLAELRTRPQISC